MKETLSYLFKGNILTKEEAKSALTIVASGTISEPEIASFLTVYLMRNITTQEILGFREAMLNLAVQVNLGSHSTIDLCGTGGDGKNTFNISTLSSFLLAGAGAKVVKHGNYGLSSPCGSSNIFEHFGYSFSTESSKLKKELDECGICYFHAPMFHPAMKNVAPVRRALKVKTFFNMLGPMTNPARPKYQFVGVFNEEVLEIYAEVFKAADIQHAIIHSRDGYDEISLTSDFNIVKQEGKSVISPEKLGFSKVNPDELHGGNTIDEAAKIFMDILEGNGTKAQKEVVVANSAFALQVYYPEKTIEECISLAKDSLDSHKALNVFNKLMSLNK